MKTILRILLLTYSSAVFAQQDQGFTFFRILNDTMTFYLNEVGNITPQSKATIYRRSVINPTSFSYKGNVKDYYLNNQKAFECTFENGELNGVTTCYYKNGQLKYHGYYKRSFKDSLWTYYYENGKIEKHIIFKSDTPYVKDYYKENGKCVFADGNGTYRGTVISGFQNTTEFKISGEIKHGRMEGKWRWFGNRSYAEEYFENGKFVKGNSYGLVYTTNPKISLTGFNLHENVDVFKFIAVPNSQVWRYKLSQLIRYKSDNNLNKTFTPELVDLLRKSSENYNLNFYWSFIQFRLTKDNVIDNVIVYSNQKRIADDLKQFILNSVGFDTAKPEDNRVDCSIYLNLFCEKGQISIPEYSSSALNTMNLIEISK